MEEAQRSKRRRVYSFDPNAITYANFSQRYLSYLLPALLRAVTNKAQTTQVETIVRFEVDMALVLSTDDFKCCCALKHNLDEGSNTNKLHLSSKCSTENEGNTLFDMLKRFEHLQTFPAIHRRVIVARQRISKKGTVRGEKELACCIRKLRKILPGGNDMGISELLSEVESYVVRLKLQVYVLRSLVDAQS